MTTSDSHSIEILDPVVESPPKQDPQVEPQDAVVEFPPRKPQPPPPPPLRMHLRPKMRGLRCGIICAE